MLIILIVSLLIASRAVKVSDNDPLPCIIQRDEENILVRVTGDVKRPGIYSIAVHEGMNELLRKCGTVESEAGLDSEKTGIRLDSGDWIIIQSNGHGITVNKSVMPAYHRVTLGIPLDINRESAEDLTAIPGIGPSLAESIVKERERRKGFEDLNEITSVPGIGPRLREKIVQYITTQ